MNIFKVIGALWSINKEAQGMKSGIATSEFWLSIAGIVTTLAMAFWGSLKPEWILLATTIIPVIYTISRTIIKATASKADDEVFNKMLEKLKPICEKLGLQVENL